jgi:hypothetical protein
VVANGKAIQFVRFVAGSQKKKNSLPDHPIPPHCDHSAPWAATNGTKARRAVKAAGPFMV